MQHVAFLLELRPEASPAEYKRRHDQIWPEMSATLREAGMRNYSIFRNGTQLFAYFEVDDWQQTLRRLDASDVNRRWGRERSAARRWPGGWPGDDHQVAQASISRRSYGNATI